MSSKNVILIGEPESGKSNYLAKLWMALRSGACAIEQVGIPEDINYVEEAVAHLHQAKFAPRTNPGLDHGELRITVKERGGSDSADLVVPDISGEVWRDAVSTLEAPEYVMSLLEQSHAALLFLRIQSPLNVDPLDWVTAAPLMSGQTDGATRKVPTQVSLCELLRFAEEKLLRTKGELPRIAVVVAAWDRLDRISKAAGPLEYLKKNFPLFAGKIGSTRRVEIGVFGLSIFGGDPEADNDFRGSVLDGDVRRVGYVVCDTGHGFEEQSDITIPLAWASRVSPVRAAA
jgi:hypothetical protein